jgi:hypothetical protein
MLKQSLATIEVARICARWEGGPEVQVVDTAAQMPVPMPPDAVGLFYRRRVFVVAQQPAQDIAPILAHEAIGHYGLRAVLGGGWRRFILAVRTAAYKGGDLFLRRVRRRVRNVYVDERGRRCLRPIQEGDEIAARVAELLFDRRTGRLLTPDPLACQAEAIVGQLAREFIDAQHPVNERQLVGALLLAEHRLRYGSLAWGASYRARRLYHALAVAVGTALAWWCWAI